MRHPGTPYLLLVLFIAITLYSCVPQQKAATTKAKLAIVDSQLARYDKQLTDLDTRRKKKQSQNEMDDTASARIQKYINRTQAEIDSLQTRNAILIGETLVKREDWEQLKRGLALSRRASQVLNGKIVFLTDLINRNTVINLDQDVIFESGKYTVSTEVADAIGKFFEPAAKEIDLFIRKYPDFPLSLVITSKGYADGTAIVEGTPLHRDLTDRLKLKGTAPDNKELNKELSRARADAVISLFRTFTTGRSVDGTNIRNIMYLYEGKGDALPNPSVTDYKVNDPRRRVVLLFWSVFPD